MEIPTQNLRNLPSGAVYADHNGQAEVTIGHKTGGVDTEDTIYVFASCDSLEIQCERYEKTIRALTHDIDFLTERTVETEERSSNPFMLVLKGFLAGMVAGMVIMIIISKKIKGYGI